MNDRIEGEPHEVLAEVQRIFAATVPGAVCELQDYQHRIGCGVGDGAGNIQEVKMLRHGLGRANADHLAQILLVKQRTGGSTAR